MSDRDWDAQGAGRVARMSGSLRKRAPRFMEADQRTCMECGMVLDQPGEFHPYIFCVLKKAGRDPWEDVLWLNKHLGLVPPDAMSRRPPLVRDLAYPDKEADRA